MDYAAMGLAESDPATLQVLSIAVGTFLSAKAGLDFVLLSGHRSLGAGVVRRPLCFATACSLALGADSGRALDCVGRKWLRLHVDLQSSSGSGVYSVSN